MLIYVGEGEIRGSIAGTHSLSHVIADRTGSAARCWIVRSTYPRAGSVVGGDFKPCKVHVRGTRSIEHGTCAEAAE